MIAEQGACRGVEPTRGRKNGARGRAERVQGRKRPGSGWRGPLPELGREAILLGGRPLRRLCGNIAFARKSRLVAAVDAVTTQ